MRHLAIRGRATTRDCVLKFLARTGEQGLFRRVLSYLSPPPLRRPLISLNICVRGYGDEVFFKLRNTTGLWKVFRAYATRQGSSLARLAFSLPASPDVLIEGCQTAEEIGLADGSFIDAMLCDEHPARLREQAAAAAAIAADAAKRYLEHLRADEQFLGAEDAEEAIAHAAAGGTWGLD